MGLQSLKDSVVAGFAKRGIAAKIARYGELLAFSINSKEKTVNAQVLLAGETEPVDLIITAYHLEEEDDQLHLVIDGANSSRKWMNNLIDDFVIGSAFPLPAAAKFALGKPEANPPKEDQEKSS